MTFNELKIKKWNFFNEYPPFNGALLGLADSKASIRSAVMTRLSDVCNVTANSSHVEASSGSLGIKWVWVLAIWIKNHVSVSLALMVIRNVYLSVSNRVRETISCTWEKIKYCNIFDQIPQYWYCGTVVQMIVGALTKSKHNRTFWLIIINNVDIFTKWLKTNKNCLSNLVRSENVVT